MEQYYTNERNVLILISLLKQYNIRKVIASPGTTNVTFVASLQQDSFFEIYSCVDERSAAYLACGLSAESGEPVILTCTGATASRNYFSGLTEAYYRKLPILAVTSTQDESRINHLIPQVIDRSVQPKDVVVCSVHLQTIKDSNDEWDCMIKTNKALNSLKLCGGGPVHINLSTTYSRDFSVKNLPSINKISIINSFDNFPELPSGKIAIFIGSHNRWNKDVIEEIDNFCATYNAVVFADPTSNYNGKFRIQYQLASQQKIVDTNRKPRLLIHIGNVSDQANMIGDAIEVWRISSDGEIQDRYRSLTHVFKMTEYAFFNHYKKNNYESSTKYYQDCLEVTRRIWKEIPKLPFSNIWVASRLFDKIPKGSSLHLGILSPLRSWSFFNLPTNIEIYCNQGGFGIDGNLSTLVGASFANREKLYFGVVGDLSFFYDINILGNRHINNNLRILLINNSMGAEFSLFNAQFSQSVNNLETYISAKGHFGNQSTLLIKNYVENLGFEYMCASTKEEFEKKHCHFIDAKLTSKPIVFEIFTNMEDENNALRAMCSIEESSNLKMRNKIKNIVGERAINLVRKIVK